MPKTKISEYSTTNSDNTDIESINIAEGCAPSGINNAIRELMVHLKEFQTGASGDAFTFAGGVLISGTANTITGNVLMSGTNTITGSTTATFAAGAVGTPSIAAHGDTNTGIFFPAADTIAFAEGGAEAMRINSDSQVVTTAGTVSLPAITTTGDTNTGIFFPAADTIAFAEGGAEAMRIDSSGNVGIGVTPSAWFSTVRTIQLPNGSGIFGTTASAYTSVYANTFNGTNGQWRYITTDEASRYDQINGTHAWYTAPSGTAGNTISFTQAMTLDASGNLGIGTTSPGYRLDVQSATAIQYLKSTTGTNQVTYIATNTGGDFYFGRDNSAGTYFSSGTGYSSCIYSGGAYPLVFFTNATERARITSGGNLDLQKNLGLGGTSATTSGTGITFPATQSASSDANTLDDYEEGTWTPAITGSSTAGTIGYDNQVGKYTKIGRQVTVSCRCDTAVVTTAPTGDLRITGLPFAPGSSNEFVGATIFRGIPFPASTTYVSAEAVSGQTYVIFTASGSDVSAAAVQANSLATDDFIYFTLTYFV